MILKEQYNKNIAQALYLNVCEVSFRGSLNKGSSMNGGCPLEDPAAASGHHRNRFGRPSNRGEKTVQMRPS
jgi:hypothetical protein